MTIEEYLKTQVTKEKKDKRKIFRYIFGILCLSIILFSLYTIFNWCLDNSKIKKINKEIMESTNINNSNGEGLLVNPPKDKNSDYYYYAKNPFFQVSFSILSSMNSDTVAYIRIRNTNIKNQAITIII